MKKPQPLKIREKTPSMSQYLFSAHNKISKIKNQQTQPAQKPGTSQGKKNSLMVNFQRPSLQILRPKAQRSLSDANLCFGIVRCGLSLSKIEVQSQGSDLKLSQTNIKKGRESENYAEEIVTKWRRSVSGMELLRKKNSQKLSSNCLLLKLSDNEKRKSSMAPKNSPFEGNKSAQKMPSLSLSKHQPTKTVKQLYNSIRHYNREQELWMFHLEQQLSLRQVIEEFQKIELNRNVQPSKKLTMRQAYQLKKQIVFEIQQQKSQSIQANIEKLADIALDDKEKDKFLMIGFFMTLRQNLMNQNRDSDEQPQESEAKREEIRKFSYKKKAIEEIKEEIKKWKEYKFEQANIINIKLLSVLTLHIMKLQSPTFTFEDLELISNTIRLKKKGQTIIDYLAEQEKIVHFESLIYIIFQFYKNLYYLKLDEEMKIEQYNSLKAYIQLYKTRDTVKFQNFQDRYKVAATIQNIQPASVGIYPYQDSRIRNQIMFKTLQKELRNSSSDEEGTLSHKPKIKINKKTLINHINEEKEQQYLNESYSSQDQFSRSCISSQKDSFRMESKVQVSEHPSGNGMRLSSNRKVLSFNRKVSITKSATSSKNKLQIKMKLDDPINLPKKTSQHIKLEKIQYSRKSALNSQNGNLKIHKDKQLFVLKDDDFVFSFVLFKEGKLYEGQFKLIPDSRQLKMSVKLKDVEGFLVFSYNFSKIKLASESITITSFQKYIWKVFKRIFILNFMPEEDPFLMKEYTQDPEHLQAYPEAMAVNKKFRLVEVIHDYLIYWAKKQPFTYNFSGKTIQTPKFHVEDFNKYMENLEFEHDRKMFQKRYGYLDSKSGRRMAISPNKNPTILFSEIRNEFYLSDNHAQNPGGELELSNNKNVMFLLKIHLPDKKQLKFLRMTFFKYVREISIFQHGFFKHTATSVIQERIPVLRKVRNWPKLNRNRLIFQLQNLLKFPAQMQINCDSDIDGMLLNKSFHIQQQFEVDLTNDFKFIPTIEMGLVDEVELKDFEGEMIKRQKLEKQHKAGMIRRKIQKEFIFGLESQQSRQKNSYILKSRRKQLKRVLTTFKISSKLFLTAQFQFTWGKRHLSILKSMQFFQMKPVYSSNESSLTYLIDTISLYKVPLMLDSGNNLFQSDDSNYYYHYVRKPFLSKLNTLIELGSNKAQQNAKKNTQNDRPNSNHNHHQNQTLFQQELHFIETKLYLTLKKQKILKFHPNNKSAYFLLQMYQTLQPPLNSSNSLKHRPLFLYQLTNLHHPQIKYFLKLQEEISFRDSNALQALIDINCFTLKGQPMEMFEIPVQKINFQNEFFEKKTKNVRKKVISEANFFFEQRILAICNNAKNSNILINVLQKYRVSKREKLKIC